MPPHPPIPEIARQWIEANIQRIYDAQAIGYDYPAEGDKRMTELAIEYHSQFKRPLMYDIVVLFPSKL